MAWADSSWWWEHGLDGIMSGIVGGLVTAAAVWATIRHERKLTERAEYRAAMQDLRNKVGELHAFGVRSMFVLPDPDDVKGWVQWTGEVFPLVLAVQVRADVHSPPLAAEMRALHGHLAAAFGRQAAPRLTDKKAVGVVVHNLRLTTQAWLSDPESYEPHLLSGLVPRP